MSDILNKIKDNPKITGIIVCVIFAVIAIILLVKKEDYEDIENDMIDENEYIQENFEDVIENYEESNSELHLQSMSFEEYDNALYGDVIENFPQKEMNVMYSDANGNLATTQDLGLKYLTVSGDSSVNGNANVAGKLIVGGELNVKNKDGRTTVFNWTDGNNYIRGPTINDGNVTINGGTTVNGATTINGATSVNGNAVVSAQLNAQRIVGGDVDMGNTGLSVHKASGDWTGRVHNPTSGSSVYMSHGGKYGMHINANNKDMGTYVLQCYAGDRNVMDVLGNGNVNIGGTVNAGSITANSIKIGNVTLTDAGDGTLRISNGNGKIEIGAKNTGWGHIYTDRPKFAFDKPLTDVSASPYKDYAKYDAENVNNMTVGAVNASGVIRADKGFKIKQWNIKPLDDSGYELRHITDNGSLYAMYDNRTWKGI